MPVLMIFMLLPKLEYCVTLYSWVITLTVMKTIIWKKCTSVKMKIKPWCLISPIILTFWVVSFTAESEHSLGGDGGQRQSIQTQLPPSRACAILNNADSFPQMPSPLIPTFGFPWTPTELKSNPSSAFNVFLLFDYSLRPPHDSIKKKRKERNPMQEWEPEK